MGRTERHSRTVHPERTMLLCTAPQAGSCAQPSIATEDTMKPNQADVSAMDDAGKLTLRVVLAVLLLFHGMSKLAGGIGMVSGLLVRAGLPGALGYLVYIGEVVAPVLILVGVYTRVAGLVVVVNMIVAILLVHTSQFFTVNQTGGWALELQGMYLGAGLVLALTGAGRYSIGGRMGLFN
jgi:putative oxidoreductase